MILELTYNLKFSFALYLVNSLHDSYIYRQIKQKGKNPEKEKRNQNNLYERMTNIGQNEYFNSGLSCYKARFYFSLVFVFVLQWISLSNYIPTEHKSAVEFRDAYFSDHDVYLQQTANSDGMSKLIFKAIKIMFIYNLTESFLWNQQGLGDINARSNSVVFGC